MNDDRARELLARERERIEQAMSALRDDDDVAGGGARGEPGERGSEDLYEQELESGLGEDLARRMAALERAEARLAAGTYGLSIASGQPIPDGRLEAVPTAELTLEEQQAADGG